MWQMTHFQPSDRPTQSSAVTTPNTSDEIFTSNDTTLSDDDETDSPAFTWTTRLHPAGCFSYEAPPIMCSVCIKHQCFQSLCQSHLLSEDELNVVKEQLDKVMMPSLIKQHDRQKQCSQPVAEENFAGVLEEDVLLEVGCTTLAKLCLRVIESLSGPSGALVRAEYACLSSLKTSTWSLCQIPNNDTTTTYDYDDQTHFVVGFVSILEGRSNEPVSCWKILATEVPAFSLNLEEDTYIGGAPMNLKLWSKRLPGLPGRDFWQMLYELERTTWETTKVMLFYPSNVFTPTSGMRPPTTYQTGGSLVSFHNILYELAADQKRRPPKAEWGYLPIVYHAYGEHHVVSLYFQLPRQNQCFGRHEPLVLKYHDSDEHFNEQGAAETHAWVSSLFENAGVPISLVSDVDSFTRRFKNGQKGAFKMCGHFSLNIYLTLGIFGRPVAFQPRYDNRMNLLFCPLTQGCTFEELFQYVGKLFELNGQHGAAPGDRHSGIYGEDALLNAKEEVFSSHLKEVRMDDEQCSRGTYPAEEDARFMLTTGTERKISAPNSTTSSPSSSNTSSARPTGGGFSLLQARHQLIQRRPMGAFELRELGNRLLAEAGVFDDTKKCLFCQCSLPRYCEDVHIFSHHQQEVTALVKKFDLVRCSLHWEQCKHCRLPVDKAVLHQHEESCADYHHEFFYPKRVVEKIQWMKENEPVDPDEYLKKNYRRRCFFCWSDLIEEEDHADHCANFHQHEIQSLIPKLNKALDDNKAGNLDALQVFEIKEMRLYDKIRGITKYFTGSPECDSLLLRIRDEIDIPTVCVQVEGVSWIYNTTATGGGVPVRAAQETEEEINVLDVDASSRANRSSYASSEEFTHRFPLQQLFSLPATSSSNSGEVMSKEHLQQRLMELLLKSKKVHDELLRHLGTLPAVASSLLLAGGGEAEHYNRLREILETTTTIELPGGFTKSPSKSTVRVKEVVLRSSCSFIRRVNSSCWESPSPASSSPTAAGKEAGEEHQHDQPHSSRYQVGMRILGCSPTVGTTGRLRCQTSDASTTTRGSGSHHQYGASPTHTTQQSSLQGSFAMPPPQPPDILLDITEHLNVCHLQSQAVRDEDSSTEFVSANGGSPFAPANTVIGDGGSPEEDYDETSAAPHYFRRGTH